MLTEGEITQRIKRELDIISNDITDKTIQKQPVFAIILKKHSERLMVAYLYIFSCHCEAFDPYTYKGTGT